jgi:catechol 2,3-dioxygenase
MSPIDPDLRIRSVELAVSDLPRSVDFYERVLGLPLISREERSAQLGDDALAPALTLTAIDSPTQLSPHSTGLYHVAWLHPSRAALAASVRRVIGEGWRFEGASDHGVSEALYLSDPDGLGIEIYADRPREAWERPPDGRGVSMYSLALDLQDLLEQSEQATAAVAPGTGIGHVHLKVADVQRASAFYRDALGFEEQAQLPSAAFVAAGGYHHHVGMNSWQSAGARPDADTAPGLRLMRFQLGDEQALEGLQRGLADATGEDAAQSEHGALRVRDPDSQLLEFAA